LKKIAYILFVAFCSSQTDRGYHHYNKTQLQEGDLLFQDLSCGELCDAITGVTKGINNKSFSHCAMVIKDGENLKVVEAVGNDVHRNHYHFICVAIPLIYFFQNKDNKKRLL
jgi:hypothetical protein